MIHITPIEGRCKRPTGRFTGEVALDRRPRSTATARGVAR